MTDKQLAEIRARLEAATQVEDTEGRVILTGPEARPITWKYLRQSDRDIAALLTEVDSLRHDVTRHMEIANEHLAEIERLREIESEFNALVDTP